MKRLIPHARLLPKVGLLSQGERNQIAWDLTPTQGLKIDYISSLISLPRLVMVPQCCQHIFRLWNCCPTPDSWFQSYRCDSKFNLNYVFDFLDHLQSDNDAPLITKVIRQCPQCPDRYMMDLPHAYHPQASSIFEYWKCLLKTRSKSFLSLLPSLPPNPRTPEYGSLVTKGASDGQDESGGGICRPILEIWDSNQTNLDHYVSFFPLDSNIRLDELMYSSSSNWTKKGLRGFRLNSGPATSILLLNVHGFRT